MRFEERKIILKDGRECILCPVMPEHAQEMADYLHTTAGESPFLTSYPDEVVYTAESEREMIETWLADDRTIMLTAMVDGKLTGNCSVCEVGRKRKVAHRCSMGIAILQEYWGFGIGKAMLEYMQELAKEAGYEQMELGVIDGNERGLKLYEKLGFVITGKYVKAIKYDDGTYRDEWIMSKDL